VARPVGGYPRGYPGVSTVCKDDCEGLVYWANQLGLQGKDYRAERDNAANAGTVGHELMDAHINQRPLPSPADLNVEQEVWDKGNAAFGSFKSWAEQSKLEITHTEMPLLSETYKFGGTFDALGRLGGSEQVYLLDWKTGNRIYPSFLMQIAAYKQLVEENGIAKIGGFHLCRFSKEEGDFSHHYFPDLDKAWEAFKLRRQLYDLMKDLKKRVG
jgi:hypothetical protein